MSETESEPDGTAGADGPGQDEHAEVERLRIELEELRQQQSAQPRRRRRVSWRTPVSALLIVIGCILAPLSVIGVWTANQVSDTNRYIANIEPLIHNPAIQNALTDKVTTAITSRLNVTARTNQAADLLTSKGLPRVGTLLKTFAPTLAGAINSYVHNTVHKIVTGPRFANAWVQVNTGGPPDPGAGPVREQAARSLSAMARSPSTWPRSSRSSNRTSSSAGSRW